MGFGPFGNKAIWEQSHLGTIGGPFGYSELGPLGTIYWAFWVQLTELSRCYRIFELPVQGWRRVIYRSPEMCVWCRKLATFCGHITSEGYFSLFQEISINSWEPFHRSHNLLQTSIKWCILIVIFMDSNIISLLKCLLFSIIFLKSSWK